MIRFASLEDPGSGLLATSLGPADQSGMVSLSGGSEIIGWIALRALSFSGKASFPGAGLGGSLRAAA